MVRIAIGIEENLRLQKMINYQSCGFAIICFSLNHGYPSVCRYVRMSVGFWFYRFPWWFRKLSGIVLVNQCRQHVRLSMCLAAKDIAPHDVPTSSIPVQRIPSLMVFTLSLVRDQAKLRFRWVAMVPFVKTKAKSHNGIISSNLT